MRSKLTILTLAALVLSLLPTATRASVLTSSISMDNGFVAYISTDDSVQGTAFSAGNNWPTTFTDTTTLAAGTDYYLHVFGYDQGGIAGFLGEFSLSGSDHMFSNGGTSLLTNLTDWVANESSGAGWAPYSAALTDLGPNGVGPWGTRPGISNSAEWIWAGNADSNDLSYFSTKISAEAAAVPEPATMVIWGVGALGFGVVAARRRKLAVK